MKKSPENVSPSESEDAIQKKKTEEEERKKISRREFLKTTGIMGGILAAGIGGGYIAAEREKREDKEHVHQGEGMVIEKIDNPAHAGGGGMARVNHMVIPVPPNRIPETFQLRIKIQGKEYVANVSKEEFTTLSVGGKVSLKYDDRDMTASSIRKIE